MSGSTITHLLDPSGFSSDPLTDLVRDGARQLIRQAVEAELAVLLEHHAADRLEDGRARLVRHPRCSHALTRVKTKQPPFTVLVAAARPGTASCMSPGEPKNTCFLS